MRDLSVLIPARQERFLLPTIQDVLKNRRANTEVIVILDGAWPLEPIPDLPDVTLVHHTAPIGQRAATNEAARLSTARYVMKLDAHCALAEGFDAALIAPYETGELGQDVTTIPAQKNLHVHDWVCDACGAHAYQCPPLTHCLTCQAPVHLEMVWRPRERTTTTSWIFDSDLHFQYDRAGQHRQRGDLCDVMSSLGACVFLPRARYWALEGLDEGHGSWGQFGTELACKSWLSGGRQVVNKRTWFAHYFRVGGLKFPYQISGEEQDAARAYSQALWRGNRWPKQVRRLDWLVDRFWPVLGWTDAQRDGVREQVTA